MTTTYNTRPVITSSYNPVRLGGMYLVNSLGEYITTSIGERIIIKAPGGQLSVDIYTTRDII